MNLDKIQYRLTADDEEIDVEAWVEGIRLGYAWTSRTDDRLQLAEWFVEPEVSIAGRTWKLRGRGIGSELLRHMLNQADAAGVREVWGCVTAEDIQNGPELLARYERHGFVVGDADAECLSHVRTAVKKIVRQKPVCTNSQG